MRMKTHIPKHSSVLRPSLEHSSTSRMSGLSKNRFRVNLSLHWGLGTLHWFWCNKRKERNKRETQIYEEHSVTLIASYTLKKSFVNPCGAWVSMWLLSACSPKSCAWDELWTWNWAFVWVQMVFLCRPAINCPLVQGVSPLLHADSWDTECSRSK